MAGRKGPSTFNTLSKTGTRWAGKPSGKNEDDIGVQYQNIYEDKYQDENIDAGGKWSVSGKRDQTWWPASAALDIVQCTRKPSRPSTLNMIIIIVTSACYVLLFVARFILIGDTSRCPAGSEASSGRVLVDYYLLHSLQKIFCLSSCSFPTWPD